MIDALVFAACLFGAILTGAELSKRRCEAASRLEWRKYFAELEQRAK